LRISSSSTACGKPARALRHLVCCSGIGIRFTRSSNSSSPIARAIRLIIRSQPIVETHQQKYSSTHLVQTRIWARP
jgi:hypothetical protein